MTISERTKAADRRLEKVTFDYSSTEDRLLMRVQAQDGTRSALWLTQRLARRLVRVLCEHLGATIIAEHAATVSDLEDRKGSQKKDQLLNFRRQAAVLNRAPGPPVPEIDTTNAFVLQKIDAQMSRHQMRLTFEMPAGPAMLALTQDHGLQLLQVLFNVFRRAEWPLDDWPTWMRNGRSIDAGGHPGRTSAWH